MSPSLMESRTKWGAGDDLTGGYLAFPRGYRLSHLRWNLLFEDQFRLYLSPHRGRGLRQNR